MTLTIRARECFPHGSGYYGQVDHDTGDGMKICEHQHATYQDALRCARAMRDTMRAKFPILDEAPQRPKGPGVYVPSGTWQQ